jgi:hypothetical protein
MTKNNIPIEFFDGNFEITTLQKVTSRVKKKSKKGGND